MSADELRRRVTNRVAEFRDRAVEYSLSARFRPATHGTTYVPASTAEEIALMALEGNALARAYSAVIGVIEEEYKRMMQPDEEPKPEQERGSTY